MWKEASLLTPPFPGLHGLQPIAVLRRTWTALRTLRSSSHCTPVAIITADYSLDDATTAELETLRAELRFKPLWVEDAVELADSRLEQRLE
jgi:hypothetical protein